MRLQRFYGNIFGAVIILFDGDKIVAFMFHNGFAVDYKWLTLNWNPDKGLIGEFEEYTGPVPQEKYESFTSMHNPYYRQWFRAYYKAMHGSTPSKVM